MASSLTSPALASPRRVRSLLPFNWGLLLLFVLFTSVIGVREAKAQWEFTLAGCITACGVAFLTLPGTVGCAACILYYGGELHKAMGGGVIPGGWDCAKANLGC